MQLHRNCLSTAKSDIHGGPAGGRAFRYRNLLGHIPGAVNIPMDQIEARLEDSVLISIFPSSSSASPASAHA